MMMKMVEDSFAPYRDDFLKWRKSLKQKEWRILRLRIHTAEVTPTQFACISLETFSKHASFYLVLFLPVCRQSNFISEICTSLIIKAEHSNDYQFVFFYKFLKSTSFMEFFLILINLFTPDLSTRTMSAISLQSSTSNTVC